MFDIYDDKGTLLKHYYPDLRSLPAYVQEAGIPTSLDKYASDDFAVTIPLNGGVKRAYPVFSDGSTAVSCLYFEHTHQNLSPELQKQAAVSLFEACKRFDVQPTEKVAELASDYQGNQIDANVLRIPFPDQGLPGTPWFPMSTTEQVKLACDNYTTIIRKLSPDERVTFTKSLMKHASDHGVMLPSRAYTWGGDRLSHIAVIEAIEKRAQYMNENQAQLLRRASEKIMQMHPEKVAELLFNIDAELGIEPYWDNYVPDPQAIREATPPSTNMIKIANVEIPRDQWDAACDAGMLDAFEPSVKASLQQNPEVLESYEGNPIFDYVVDRLEDLGIVEKVAEVAEVEDLGIIKKASESKDLGILERIAQVENLGIVEKV